MDYKGYIEVQLDDNKLAAFYNNKDLYVELYELKENEYLLIKDSTGEIVDKYCYQNGKLRQVKYNIIQNAYCGKIKPRNLQQELAIDMLIDSHSKVKLVQGVYGSGKDYLMLNQALSLIEKGKFQKIVVTEGQNITSEIAKLIISRIGDNSELWFNCDTHQVDKQVYEKDNGVNKMIDRLTNNSLFAYVYLPKTERSAVAELCTLLDD